MTQTNVTRRVFLGRSVAAATAVGWLQAGRSHAVAGHGQTNSGSDTGRVYVATNVYPWYTFYRREKRDFNADLDAGLAAVARAGLDGFESIVNTPEDVDRLGTLLKKHGLQMKSFYVNSVLHERKAAEESIERIVELARKAKAFGAKIVVTNPSPKSWNRKAKGIDKNDQELEIQAAALDRLGAALRQNGLTLAYHNHDMELRNAAREFHHMLLATKPENVGFCLDAHWIFRGSGDSQVALFDVVQLYGRRVVEIHLRQSKDGVWTEAFGPGDIDYARLFRTLKGMGVSRPHLVLEQAVEADSPKTLDAVEAHRRGAAYVRRLWKETG